MWGPGFSLGSRSQDTASWPRAMKASRTMPENSQAIRTLTGSTARWARGRPYSWPQPERREIQKMGDEKIQIWNQHSWSRSLECACGQGESLDVRVHLLVRAALRGLAHGFFFSAAAVLHIRHDGPTSHGSSVWI